MGLIKLERNMLEAYKALKVSLSYGGKKREKDEKRKILCEERR